MASRINNLTWSILFLVAARVETGHIDDENKSNVTLFRCSGGFEIDWNMKCDGDDDCGNWDDECDCGEPKSTLCDMIPCLNGLENIRRRQVCDGLYDCEDLSDECLCDRITEENENTYSVCQKIFSEGFVCAVGEISCTSVTNHSQRTCLPGHLMCDGRYDCVDHIDEIYCATNTYNVAQHRKQVCKSIVSDENATARVPLACRCDGKVELPGGADEQNCSRFFYCPSTARSEFDWTAISPNKSYSFAGVPGLMIDWRMTYDGVADCPHAADEWQPRDKLFAQPRSNSTAVGDDVLHPRYMSSAEYFIDSRVFIALQWIIGFITTVGNGYVIITILRSLVTGVKNSFDAVRICNHFMVLSLSLGGFAHGIKILALVLLDAIVAGSYWKHEMDWISSSLCLANATSTFITTSATVFTAFTIATIRLHTVLNPFKMIKVKYVSLALLAAWVLGTLQALPPITTGIPSLEKYFTRAVALPNLPHVGSSWVTRTRLENLVTKASILHNMHQRSDLISIRYLKDMKWRDLESTMTSLNHDYGGWKYFHSYSTSSMCIPTVVISAERRGWEVTIGVFTENLCAYLFVVIFYCIVLKKTTSWSTFRYFLCFDDSMEAGGVYDVEMTNNNSVLSGNEDIKTRRKNGKSGPMLPKLDLVRRRKKEDFEMQKRIFWIIFTDIACWAPICFLNYAIVITHASYMKSSLSLSICIILAELNSMINPFLYSKQMRKTAKLIILSPINLIRNGFSKLNGQTIDDEIDDERITTST